MPPAFCCCGEIDLNTHLEITYRNMESSPSTDHVVREQLEKLERHCPSLVSCRVVIAAPTAKHTKGGHFKVAVDLTLPGNEIIADRDPDARKSHEDCHAAVRDSFRAALIEVDKLHARAAKSKRKGG